jgi:hypothetical protein
VATTAPQGAANFDKVDVSPLHGADVVAIVHRDSAGEKWAQQVGEALAGKAASLELCRAKAGNDDADHIAAGFGLDDFEPVDLEDEASRIRRLFPRLNWHALWADDQEEEWILYPLVPARRLVALYSPAKLGKSLLTLEVAVGISRGATVLGHTPSKRRRVLYVDFENDPRGDVRERLRAMGYRPNDLDNLDYLSFPTLADLDSERGGLELLAAIAAYGSEFVVIDTISRAVKGEENSNDTWLDFYRHTGLKLKQAGVALLRLDHTGKDETKGQRGGSAKAGDVDAVWRLVKVTDERFRLECTDSRFQLVDKSLHLTRHDDPLRHTVDNLSDVTDREAKIRHIIALADEANEPRDASRETLRTLAKGRGIKAANDVLAEVVRRRKLSPSRRDNGSDYTTPNSPEPSGTAGDSAPENGDSEPKTTVPDPSGQPRTGPIGPTVPVPSPRGGDRGTTGQPKPHAQSERQEQREQPDLPLTDVSRTQPSGLDWEKLWAKAEAEPEPAPWPNGVNPYTGRPLCGCGGQLFTEESQARGWCQRCEDHRNGRRATQLHDLHKVQAT